MSDVGGRMTEVRGWGFALRATTPQAEGRGRMSEVGDQMSEDRGQKTEGRRQRTDTGCRVSEAWTLDS